jgi:hypothetical protein
MNIKPECISVLSDWFGLDITLEQFDDIISRQKPLWDYIEEDGCPGDTMIREFIVDMVVKDFGLDYWPLNGSSPEYTSTFFAKFSKIATDRGYKLNFD